MLVFMVKHSNFKLLDCTCLAHTSDVIYIRLFKSELPNRSAFLFLNRRRRYRTGPVSLFHVELLAFMEADKKEKAPQPATRNTQHH